MCESSDSWQAVRNYLPLQLKYKEGCILCRSEKHGDPHTTMSHRTREIEWDTKQLNSEFSKYSKAPKYNYNSDELFCICRKPDSGQLMVACDGCDEWFHFRCMKLDLKYKALVANFYCIFCDNLFHKGETLWKRKCRLPKCFQPINIEMGADGVPVKHSKYCCEEHGEQFMREQVLNPVLKLESQEQPFGLTIAAVSRVLKDCTNINQFKSLGKELPVFEKDNSDLPEELSKEVKSIDDSVVSIQAEIDFNTLRVKYIQKAKDRVKVFNEAIDSLKLLQQEKKAKPKKADLCGYDSLLSKDDGYWKQNLIGFASFESLVQTEKLTTLEQLNVAEETFERCFKQLSEEDAVMEENNPFSNICTKEKRRCLKHYSWYSIVSDELDLRLQDLENKVEELKKRKEDLFTSWNSMCWETLQ